MHGRLVLSLFALLGSTEVLALRTSRLASEVCTRRARGVTLQLAALAGGQATDEADFRRDPLEFCTARARREGDVFSTSAFGGAVLAGSDAALALAAGDDAELEAAELEAPFSTTDQPYEALSDAMNRDIYKQLFEFIPRFKEQGGFSTFRFDDFLDARIRSVRPSVRRVLFRATLPVVLGLEWDELERQVVGGALAALDISSIKELFALYDAYARQTGGSAGGLAALLPKSPLPFKLPIGGGGDEQKLQRALATLARGGAGGEGAALLRTAFSSIEQTGALACNMLAATARHPDWEKQLVAEEKTALKGHPPEDPIGPAQLAAMPKLNAFALETLRLQPPARPSPLRLRAALELGGVQLKQGTLLQPEPFIANTRAEAYPEPLRFDPARFLQDEPAEAPIGFAGPAQRGAAGAELATSLAKATFVQMRRMFDLQLDRETPLVPTGYPIFSVPEGGKVRAIANMYYELKRDVKKLKF